MKVGIDARAAAEEPGGRGRYVRELLRRLPRVAGRDQFVLYAREPWQEAELDERFRWSRVPAPDPVWHVLAAIRASRECDVFLSTNSYLTLWFLRVPGVAVVYDMVAFDPEVRPRLRSRLIERATIAPALRRAAALAAISESTRRDLLARFPAAAGKAVTVPLAADEEFRPEGEGDEAVLGRHDLEPGYLLAIGTLEPRKNLTRLIQAFASVPADARAGVRLVIVGATGWETDETFAAIAGHRELVRTLGYVPDAELPALYRGAKLFCYPSLYEGFGLPVLEAMSCGTPVITSGVSSLPEVGGDAAEYVDPRDPADIARALEELLADGERREELARRGLVAAARFSWERTTRETLALLESAARAR
jgi:glycosyltransferase involved in cell wall biosynthesis